MRAIAKSATPQNKRHRMRTTARHTGHRQKPAMHEHMAMMFPHHENENPAEEAGETPAQEQAEEAAGQS